MKKFLLLLLIFLPIALAAQSPHDNYIYCVVTPNGDIVSKDIKIKIDDGRKIEKLKDQNGKDIKFRTFAGIIMYFTSKGWSLYSNESTTDGSNVNGSGTLSTSTHWIFRKPCTREELDSIVKESITPSPTKSTTGDPVIW